MAFLFFSPKNRNCNGRGGNRQAVGCFCGYIRNFIPWRKANFIYCAGRATDAVRGNFNGNQKIIGY